MVVGEGLTSLLACAVGACGPGKKMRASEACEGFTHAPVQTYYVEYMVCNKYFDENIGQH